MSREAVPERAHEYIPASTGNTSSSEEWRFLLGWFVATPCILQTAISVFMVVHKLGGTECKPEEQKWSEINDQTELRAFESVLLCLVRRISFWTSRRVMHTRRTSTLPVLSLALPRPALPRMSSSTPTPQTPLTGKAPALARTRSLSSPRTSSDSWGSFSEHGEDERVDWSQENVSLLARVRTSRVTYCTTQTLIANPFADAGHAPGPHHHALSRSYPP